MGSCFEPKAEIDIPSKIQKLKNLQNQMTTTEEMNEAKIEQLNKKISNYDEQLKQGENDLRQNQYSYSEAEKKEKVAKLFEIKKDRLRVENQRKNLNLYNNNLKDNLSAIESKINELTNYELIEKGNEIMKDIGMIDTGDALAKNIEIMMRQNENELKKLEIIEKGNKEMFSELGNEEDYFKQIFNGGTSGGAPPAY